jgi:hypothetical protein
MNTLRLITLLTALVIFGEALALTVGMVLVQRGQNPWFTPRNAVLLGLDLLLGGLLIYLAWSGSEQMVSWALIGAGLISLLAHAYRDLEYFSGTPLPFCANQPLFIVNNLKLLGLLIVTVWGVFSLTVMHLS